MREQLGRDPVALYRYTPNRASLLDDVAELVLDQPVSADGQDWPGAADLGVAERRTLLGRATHLHDRGVRSMVNSGAVHVDCALTRLADLCAVPDHRMWTVLKTHGPDLRSANVAGVGR